MKFANWQNNCSCIRIYIVEARSEEFGVKSTYANQHVNVVYFLFFHKQTPEIIEMKIE